MWKPPSLTDWWIAGGLITYLFSSLDAPTGADDDLVLLLNRHHLRDAVGRTWMVNVPVNHRWKSGLCKIWNPCLNECLSPHPDFSHQRWDYIDELWMPRCSFIFFVRAVVWRTSSFYSSWCHRAKNSCMIVRCGTTVITNSPTGFWLFCHNWGRFSVARTPAGPTEPVNVHHLRRSRKHVWTHQCGLFIHECVTMWRPDQVTFKTNWFDFFSPGGSSCDGGVDHIVIINPEHVHTSVLHTPAQTHETWQACQCHNCR